MAERYTVAGSAEQGTLIEMGHAILQTKNTGFLLASVLFGIGTMTYSYLFRARAFNLNSTTHFTFGVDKEL